MSEASEYAMRPYGVTRRGEEIRFNAALEPAEVVHYSEHYECGSLTDEQLEKLKRLYWVGDEPRWEPA